MPAMQSVPTGAIIKKAVGVKLKLKAQLGNSKTEATPPPTTGRIFPRGGTK